jgi:fatty acid desaturase
MPAEKIIKMRPRRRRRFPTFATILLVVALLWLLSDMNVLTINVPWIPVILIIIAIGWIFNAFTR